VHSQLDGKQLHVTLTPFLEKNTSLFMKELWSLLASANTTASHIPQQLLEAEAARQATALKAQQAIQVTAECPLY
jgi:serine/arginine repetitive matrix protein 1